ncbi:SsrA-binding protein SmpB [Calidifontibacter terrae]
MPRESGKKIIANNKKARHDYFIEETVEAGLVLMGTEVKSLRMGRANLTDGFASERSGELWLENVHIPEYLQGTWTNHSAKRRRKLLLHRHEMAKLISKSQESGQTLIPLSLYFLDGRAKVEIGLARGKKLHDKRETLREKQDNREAARAVSDSFKRGRR